MAFLILCVCVCECACVCEGESVHVSVRVGKGSIYGLGSREIKHQFSVFFLAPLTHLVVTADIQQKPGSVRLIASSLFSFLCNQLHHHLTFNIHLLYLS